MLKVAEARVEKQLDLIKIIRGKRTQMYATFMSIQPQEALIIDKMATMTI